MKFACRYGVVVGGLMIAQSALSIAAGGHPPYQMPWAILLIFGGLGPSVIGILMVLLTLDREGQHDFWRRCYSFKRISGLRWLIIFALFPIL